MNQILQYLQNRIMLMVGRCILRIVDDAQKIQNVQIGLSEDETRKVERFQNYGFTSVPLPGSEGVMVSVSGNRDHGIVIAMDDKRYRLKGLQNGEVAVYNNTGSKIVLKSDGSIEVISDNIKLGASAGLRALIDDRFVAVYNTHTHGGSVPAVQIDGVITAVSTSKVKAL